MKKLGFLYVFLTLFGAIQGQNLYEGQVLDYAESKPLDSVFISSEVSNTPARTNAGGWFLFTDTENSPLNYKVENNIFVWNGNNNIEAHFYLVDLYGKVWINKKLETSEGSLQFPKVQDGIYILKIYANLSTESSRIYIQNNEVQPLFVSLGKLAIDSLYFEKEGYTSITLPIDKATNAPVFLLKKSYGETLDYFSEVPNYAAFSFLKSEARKTNFGDVESLKVLYDFTTEEIYYIQSDKYEYHYSFASQVLKYSDGHPNFNRTQYTNNTNRKYFLFTLNFHKTQNKYLMEFFGGDEISCEEMATVYHKVKETTYFGDNLYLYNNHPKLDDCFSAPFISSNELYKGVNYQALSLQKSFGYLKLVDIADLDNTYLGKRDIIVLNDIPNDIPVVSGIITTKFQTPLSHINVLSHNRETPNMGLADALENPKITDLLGSLVCLEVLADSFRIRQAELPEAEAFWSLKEPSSPIYLDIDTTDKGLVDFTDLEREDVDRVGGKAANFSVLASLENIPIPENAFAIPFTYYERHIRRNRIHLVIDALLEDEEFYSNQEVRQQKLETIRNLIESFPLDDTLLNLVQSKIKNFEDFESFRFRSSTNAEDLENFSGAGLYSSYSAKKGDSKKTIERAIKKVWASLWNFRAFEEREYYKIDHRTVSMGILAHRSFPDEEANGVIVTRNLYNSNDGIIINVQYGEIPVVYPKPNIFGDEIMVYFYSWDENKETTLEYLTRSNILPEGQNTVLTEAEVEEVSLLCQQIKYHYYFNEEHSCDCILKDFALDIEFKIAITDGKRKLYIKQARPYK